MVNPTPSSSLLPAEDVSSKSLAEFSSQKLKPVPDFAAIQKLWEETSIELSESRNHPASDLELPPTCLLIYDSGTAPKRFTDRDFIDTPIGRACREWNSRKGIPYAAWCLILSSASMCSSCLRMFSIDGYAAHVVNGACTYCSGSLARSPQVVRAPLHPASDSRNPPHELQAYLHDFNLAFTLFDVPDHMHSAIGRAFLEWNSRNGVSYTVWHMISTALVRCPSCNLVRSFDGDTDHRRVGGCGFVGINDEPAQVRGVRDTQ